jgi:hypothetical protein
MNLKGADETDNNPRPDPKEQQDAENEDAEFKRIEEQQKYILNIPKNT